MTYIKRTFFFILVNVAIITTLSALVFGIEAYTGYSLGQNFTGLIALYTIFGMGGAFFSLFTSKWMVKRGMGVKVISPTTQNSTEKWILNSVYQYARSAGLKNMPEVGIYNSPEMNAFATGPSKNNSLVAVSSGLLESMSKDEVEGVIGHEIAHIANGDMVTLTLIQGVVNTIAMLLARLITEVIASKMDSKGRGMSQFFIYMFVVNILGIFGSIVVNWFSRHREFRADHGGAKYAGRDKMVKALEKLQEGQRRVKNQVPPKNSDQPAAVAALKISGYSKGSFLKRLFMTHPPLEERIHALRSNSL